MARTARIESATEAVVNAVSELTGSDPMDLEPLYRAIDPDALEAMVATGPVEAGAETRVSFSYSGCDVVVSCDGVVEATRTGARAREAWA